MYDERTLLRKCDTGELSCFTCIGRENCTAYAYELPTLHTKVCFKCGNLFLSDQLTLKGIGIIDFSIPETECCPKCTAEANDKNTAIQNAVNWVELYTKDELCNLDPEGTLAAVYFSFLENNPQAKKSLLVNLEARVKELLLEDANKFPFRSGYNLSICFQRQVGVLNNISMKLIENLEVFEEVLKVYHDFFVNRPDDMIEPLTDITNDSLVFTHFGKKIACYENLLNRLSELLEG